MRPSHSEIPPICSIGFPQSKKPKHLRGEWVGEKRQQWQRQGQAMIGIATIKFLITFTRHNISLAQIKTKTPKAQSANGVGVT